MPRALDDFRESLDLLIDEALERGCSIDDIAAVACKRFALLATAVMREQLDLAIKFFSTLFCLVIPAAIYGLKTHAAWHNKAMPQDELLNWVCLVCLVAVMSQFFRSVIPLVDKLLTLLKRR